MEALLSRELWVGALFLFLYAFAPGFGTPLYYYMADTLRFSQQYIGVLGSIASAGWIAGGLLHRWLLWRMSSKALLYLSIVLGTLTAASFLLLGDELSAAVVNFANGVAAMIATIASLSLAAHYCPRRAEGFAFAGLTSVLNLADVGSSNAGAFLYERVFDNHLAPLIVVPRRRLLLPSSWFPCCGSTVSPCDGSCAHMPFHEGHPVAKITKGRASRHLDKIVTSADGPTNEAQADIGRTRC